MVTAIARNELAEKERRAGPGDPAQGVGDQLEVRMGLAGVRARITRVVVQLVGNVPSKDAIAEPAAVAG